MPAIAGVVRSFEVLVVHLYGYTDLKLGVIPRRSISWMVLTTMPVLTYFHSESTGLRKYH